MAWIVAATTDTADLPEDAVAEFRDVAKDHPTAPWRIESGHLRGGRELLEEMTDRSWEEVDMPPAEVKAVYDAIVADDRWRVRPGMAAAVIAFLGVCARHGFSLEGGIGARKMRR